MLFIISKLVILVLTLTFSKIFVIGGSICSDHEFSLEFPSRQRSQLAYSTVRINGDKDIDAFTICLWLKPSTLGSDLGLLRYFDEAGSNVYFALRLGDVGQLWISIHGEDRELDIMPQIQDGVWHGLCVTWNKHGGHFMIYYDGRLIRSENGLKSGNSFPSNETFTLGIGAEEKFNYTGMVGHVNIWPSVLEHSLLSVLSSKCGVERGGLVSWPQFRKDLRGVDVHTRESCPFNEVQITHEENHWKLDGDDKDLNPKYSAVFLEGRLDGHKAVYLDQTMSYIEAPRLSLGTAFSITCWVKLLYSTPVYRPILSVETNSTEKFSIGFNADSQLLLDKWSQGVYNITKSYASLPANQWIHVAVTFAQEGVLSFFFDGMKNLSVAGVWQGPRSGAFEIGRYKNVSEDKHRHFHGFLSDLYVFSKNLTAEEIGRLMGRSYPCTLSEWSSDAKLTPHQTPRKKYRHKSCPGIGECKEVRKWKPADCREVLLSGCKTSAKYTISPLNNHEEFEVFCDQETQGGGWTVIQQRINGSVSFNRTWDEYKAGFGVMGVQLEMWLGNERIHSLTTQKTEILIELTAFDGTKGFAYYSHFHVAGEDLWYQLSVGGFSGNIPDKLVLHDTFNFSVTKCGAATSSSGWWFTPSCGEALLNSEYGHDTGSMMWSDFPVAGAHKGKIKKSTMKIRRTEDHFEDYTLKFPERKRTLSIVTFPVILTEFQSFTSCLWLKVRPPTVPRQMNLLRYVVQDGNFSMGLKPYGKEYKIILSIWPSTRGFNKQVKYPSLDGSWRHVCTSWTNVDGRGAIYIDDTQTPFLGIGNGTKFTGGGKVVIGSTHVVEPPLLGLEITYMNLWDKVLSTVSIENLAHSCGAEAGNVLQWSLFAAMSVGNVQVVPSSACRAKEMYYWNFNQSNSLESFDGNKNHRAELTGGKISPDQKYLVIEDQGKFLAENLSSELSGENGFTVSFSAGQTVLASEILRNDFKSLEVLHRAFPDFIRDHATWKRCYFADQSSWSTAEFHTKCDYKGSTLTIVRVREYVFGGFVENSWGGKPSNIGHQIEGFLFSLSNPFDLAPRILPIQQGKASGRTNPHLGPSFGERDLELFEDKHGRIMGYSRLGASFDLMSVSLSSYEAWFYLAGSQHFYPDQVEVFYYHVPSTPLGLENQILPDNYLSNSSQLNSSSGPHLARLNEQRDSKAWCSAGPNEWLQVFLGKQYTLTHMALQSIGGGVDVTELKVQYEKTRDGIKWKYYSKEIDGKEMLKVLRFNFPSAGFVKKEAFIPPFQAVKVRFLLTETRVQCIKMELYFYDAGCSQPHGIENRTVVPDEKLTASSTEVSDEYKQGYFWPNIGRLNHDKEGAHSWGPYKHPVHLFKGIWFQVDLKEETEVTCIATQGRPTNIQWPTKYQLAYSSEGNDWKYFENINGVKKFDANSDQHMAVTNWLVPSIYGRFFRVYITRCNIACRLRMELYGRRDPTNNIYWSKNGLSFTVRRGRYHIFFAKENHRWEIRHPLIVNQWFEATIAWKLQDGLKFYVNGNLVASDKIPVRRNFFPAKEPFKLLIASMENGGGWSRAISIDDVAVWGKAMSKEEINRKSEVHFDFDDNSRDWESLVDGTNGWTLLQGCTKTSGTGPCDDVSRGGRYIYFDAAQSKEKARFSTPSSIHSYNCLKFHYHMTGTHTGRLNVYATDIRGKEQLLWRLFGEQKNTWRKASIPVNDIHPQYQVVFEAVRGPGYLGDIALDQIAFTRESCVFSPSSAMPHNSHRSGVVITSSIVSMDSIYHNYLGLMMEEEVYSSSRWISCYRALDNGWNVSTFHNLCDDKGPTLTIIRKENNVFGGFTERNWSEGQVGDNSSYDLQFWRKNSADIVKSVLPTLTPNSSFTASLWLKTSVKSTLIVFSIGQIDSFLQLRLEPSGWLSLCSKDKCNTNNGSISQVINDGCWHHVTVVWHSSSKSWTVFSDGVNRGKQTEEKWQKSTFSLSGTLFIGKEQIQGSSRFFSGRITQFNMWNHELEEKDITVLARNCVSGQGNMFHWSNLRSKVEGELRIVEPSSCLSTNYRADTKAFIFSLNYTSDGTLFKKEISKESSALATYSSPYTGPTFGESPFDFQIGIDGDMKRGTSQHSVSYKEEEDSSKSNLETVLAGASSFNVNDVEVLYRAQGASLCSNRCPFYHYCDEITGICRCRNKDPALCQLVKFYEDSSHFWLLESMDDIKDLRTPGWGKSKGGVSSFGDGLVTDGVNGEVILNHEGDTCATKSAEAHCDDSGFTVSLSLKPSYKAGGERQTFFKSRGKFVVYQERQKKSLIIRVQRSAKYCLKEIAMPEKIWSHLAFTYEPSQPRTLTVYRNGRKIDKFIRDEGCEVDGEPEFSSTSMSLGSEGGLFAKAHYYLIAIWGQVLSEERITQIYRGIQGSVPLRCRVVARIKNQLWNEDLTSPETDPYRAMTNEIISNVTRFYEGIRVTVTVNEFRNGSVIADFTIIYNVSDYKLIERLQQNISSTGFLYNMPLEVEEFTAENVPEVAPTNISVLRVEDTSIHIRWNSLSLPPSISAIFQGYKVFIRSVGRADVIVTTVTVNDLVNFVTIKGLESLVTYNLTVAGYTLSGVGRESESFSVTTPLDDPPEDVSVERVTSNCVQIKWGGLPPEKLAAFDGYRVFYALFSHPTFSLNTTVNSSTHRVEICSLESSMKYKFYVQRILRKDVGNASDVKYFTTEIVMRLAPTNVTCRNTSSTSIEVHWAPPSVEVNSLEIIGYDLHFRPHGLATELWSTLLACNRTLSATIKSLEKYTEYDIRVTIFITNGRGNFSEIVRCFTDEDIPLGGPVNISAENTSSTGINISWSPVPETLRLGIINKYIFNITDLLTGYLRTIEFDGPSLNGEVRNLSKYQEYSIQGAAVNSKGRSNFTNAITCRTSEDAPDIPPENLTGYNISSTSIAVEFNVYSTEKLNGIIRQYVFKIFKANVANSTVRTEFFPTQKKRKRRELSNTIGIVKAMLEDLEEYTMYSLQAAFFTIKEGPYSAVLNVSTDEGVLRVPPHRVTAFNSSSSSIMVKWEPLTPANVPGILLGYVLRIEKADDPSASNFTLFEIDPSITQKNVTDLEVYTLYSIYVAGYTRKGKGSFRAAQSWTDEGIPQGPPNNVTGRPTSTNSIALSWLPVTKELQKGKIRGYQVKIYGDEGAYVHNSTILIPKLYASFMGLKQYSNYSLKVRAFTSKGFGPWSSMICVSTSNPAPTKIPTNVKAVGTSASTIRVTWGPISGLDAQSVQGYRVLHFTRANPSQSKVTVVGRSDIHVTITGLRPFTAYGVQIAAFITTDGNYTLPVYAQTREAAPSAPPSNFRVTAFDSHSLLISWLDVPSEHRNGIISGYRLTYTNASNRIGPVITERAYSVVLTQLRKATEYRVILRAFNNAGDGVSVEAVAKTGEDVPSRSPSKITAQNHTSLTEIPVSWEPVPQEFIHGRHVGYRVTYQAVSIGDLPAYFEPVMSLDVGTGNSSILLQNLEPLVVYKITVAAISNKGPGPEGVTYGETCRCHKHLTTNWRNYPPYVNMTSFTNSGIIIPRLLEEVINECCGECLEYGKSELDFQHNGNNETAQQNRSEYLLQNIDTKTDFSFPVNGYKLQDSYKGGLGYSPFVESAGVAFLTYQDSSGVKHAMFVALLACWPVVVLPLMMAYIAGVIVWLLDAKSNNQHFPASFVHGTWEGVWWAFVSMTTVGYGDRTPVSQLGRIFAVGWVLTGLVIIAITTAAITTALTKITAHSKTTIYGSKVGAIQGSPEYHLGIRRNAILNKEKKYHSLEELSEALISREVEGILVDTYAGGMREDLFSRPSIQVTQIVDYQTAYGVVISGDSMRLRQCFHGYMRSHQAKIFQFVDQLVEPIRGSGLSDRDAVEEVSTGLFDKESDLYQSTLVIIATCALTAAVLGLLYEAVRRLRERKRVRAYNLSQAKEKITDEMKLLVKEFVQRLVKTLALMKERHMRELQTFEKITLKRKTAKLNHEMTGSTTLRTKHVDDISTVDLNNMMGSASRC